MRRDILQTVQGTSAAHRLNVLRELLQWEVVAALHQAEAFNKVAFIGGTSLRLLRDLGRYSETLDFSTIAEGFNKDQMEIWRNFIVRRIEGCGIRGAEFKISGTGAVLAGDLRLSGVMKEVGLAQMEDQKLKIKIEVDTNPPEGALVEKTLHVRPQMMTVTTYELPSLMAGKLHALLARPYTKGRDWYDLLWYCGNQTEPNTEMLDNALVQIPSEWCDDAQLWRRGILAKAEETDWNDVQRDVARFLEHDGELASLNLETVTMAVSSPSIRKRRRI